MNSNQGYFRHFIFEPISPFRVNDAGHPPPLSIILSLLPSEFSDSDSLSSLADSDRPARSLLESPDAYSAVASSLSSPLSGSGDDPLCQWPYDTFQSSDSDLRPVVLSFVPLLTGLYLSRLHSSSSTIETSSPSLSGFEAVLALYASESKSRAGKPLIISILDLSQSSLYHNPNPSGFTTSNNRTSAFAGKARRVHMRRMSDADLRKGLCEFVSSFGFPDGHVPSTKELAEHGRKDLANIVRRRGYKVITELLANSDEVLEGSNLEDSLVKEQNAVHGIDTSTKRGSKTGFLMGRIPVIEAVLAEAL